MSEEQLYLFEPPMQSIYARINLDPAYGWCIRVSFIRAGEEWGDNAPRTYVTGMTKKGVQFVMETLGELLLGEEQP